MSLLTRNAVLALGITLLIIGTVTYAVHYMDQQRLADITAIEARLSTDTLSLETQFSLLENAPCENLSEGTSFSKELSDLGDRLSFAEGRLGSNDPQVVQLKKEYVLLEIRDYLLMQKLSKTCAVKPVTVLYFYSNAGDCSACDRAGYALSYLRQTYPHLRVYSFDYNLDLGALKTLVAVEKVKDTLPAFVIQGKLSYGFTSLTKLEAAFPKSAFATSTATSTVGTN
ncbi:MAG: hypothetical protein B7X04_03390 [Parcubacteria group bacterium 21-54-25]|nr:MAG: hypothetical protein B7X04_03390 [Parcubacteria group bacterium 21-54-25]HQU08028.1 hypothetical protein [Candidatus Paceibacterota bacterium]